MKSLDLDQWCALVSTYLMGYDTDKAEREERETDREKGIVGIMMLREQYIT